MSATFSRYRVQSEVDVAPGEVSDYLILVVAHLTRPGDVS